MSQAQKEKNFSSNADKSKLESTKHTSLEESETDGEEESEEESDESGSSSDDDELNHEKAARSAGTDLGGKAGKKKEFSFENLNKLLSKKR